MKTHIWKQLYCEFPQPNHRSRCGHPESVEGGFGAEPLATIFCEKWFYKTNQKGRLSSSKDGREKSQEKRS